VLHADLAPHNVLLAAVNRSEKMKYAIIVADGVRARFFSHEPRRGGPRACRIVEQLALTNPELQIPPHERFEQSRYECRGRVFGHYYGLADHRLRHDAYVERKFAERVSESALTFAEEHGAGTIVFVANPKMLGFLRSARPKRTDPTFHVVELARDLASFSPERIENALINGTLIPVTRAHA
jgi:protein required for attachment to host cells